MDAYIYAADIWCEACGKAIRKRLTKGGKRPKDWRDETTYDSDEFPKGPYDNGGGECDGPQHCASREECLEPTEIDGEKYGRFLENDLTDEGCAYVLNLHMESNSAVTQFWMDHYSEEIGYYLDAHPKHPYHQWKKDQDGTEEE